MRSQKVTREAHLCPCERLQSNLKAKEPRGKLVNIVAVLRWVLSEIDQMDVTTWNFICPSQRSVDVSILWMPGSVSVSVAAIHNQSSCGLARHDAEPNFFRAAPGANDVPQKCRRGAETLRAFFDFQKV